MTNRGLGVLRRWRRALVGAGVEVVVVQILAGTIVQLRCTVAVAAHLLFGGRERIAHLLAGGHALGLGSGVAGLEHTQPPLLEMIFQFSAGSKAENRRGE